MDALDPSLIDRTVGQIADLARNDEACKLLGIEGVLEGQLDVAFLNDPVEWLASDIANAIQASVAEEDDDSATESLTLDIIVAEFRLARLLSGSIDEADLAVRVAAIVDEAEG